MLAVDVVLPLAIHKLLSYRVPPELEEKIEVGSRVIVPLRKTKFYTGLVWNLRETENDQSLNPIHELLDERPLLDDRYRTFLEWVARYYMSSLGEVMAAAVPALLRPDSETEIVLKGDFEFQTSLFDDEWQKKVRKQGRVKLSEMRKKAKGDFKRLLQQAQSSGQTEMVETVDLQQDRKKKNAYCLSARLREDVLLLEVEIDQLVSAPRQQELMLRFLKLIHNPHTGKLDLHKAVASQRIKTRQSDQGLLRQLEDKDLLEKTHLFADNQLSTPHAQAEKLPELADFQAKAYEETLAAFSEGHPVLLHGITGSGKTEIYAHFIREALEKGQQVLYLLPEIALTSQLIRRLGRYFGSYLAVYHSKYNNRQRATLYREMAQGKAKLIVGARSSVFLPFRDLGLVIVDEEHDSSYKQHDPAPRYHGRDTAHYLSMLHHADLILGTATPALETWYLCEKGKMKRVRISQRFGKSKEPEIELVKISRSKNNPLPISEELKAAVEEALDREKQVILFQNRRGYSPYLECGTCQYIPFCQNCDVSLTYHQFRDRMVCHYCGYHEELPEQCPNCGEATIYTVGSGTERVEESVQLVFPDARLTRLDTDTSSGMGNLERIIEQFSAGKKDILIGTQMVTKGLDFDHVSVVGVADADSLLYYPDFRSSERTFQLILQVSGRAGRRNESGRVLLQSSYPEHSFYHFALSRDFEAFYAKELEEREKYAYPPYSRIIELTLKHKDFKICLEASKTLAKWIRRHTGAFKCLGPEAPPVGRVRNHYLQQIMVKAFRSQNEAGKFKQVIQQAVDRLAQDKSFKQVRVNIDVDPV